MSSVFGERSRTARGGALIIPDGHWENSPCGKNDLLILSFRLSP